MSKIINVKKEYDFYDDSMVVFDKLPAQVYIIRFAKMRGFYLEQYADIEIKEEKIYGVCEEKVAKVLNAFHRANRNLGVILSGDKGIGKSLCAKLLAENAVKRNIPVIIVDKFYPNIAQYIETIEQEVMVLFDEFDKTFANIKTSENEAEPQAGLLSLFDGISQGKKLFVITCNKLNRLNDFLINRPGRFHYHFRFEYPSERETREYLQDKLSPEYWDEIEPVVAFSRKVNLNYDCLRAIAFELNAGDKFSDAIKDMNILNTEDYYYIVKLYFENGYVMTRKNTCLDLFDDELSFNLKDAKGRNIVKAKFSGHDCKYDIYKHTNIVNAENLELEYDTYFEDEDDFEEIKQMKPAYMTITRIQSRGMHYDIR